MENKKTHIRSLQDNNYFGEWDLPMENEGKLVVQVSDVKMEKVTGTGNTKKNCSVVYFNAFAKGLVLNSTNRKTITKIAKSPFIENWIGLNIELYRLKGLRAFGGVVDAVRVTPTAPTIVLPELTKTHARYKGVIDSIKGNTATIDMIKKHFTISTELENELKQIKIDEN